MAKAQKISISLPKEMVDDIRFAVDSGRYSTASEVVREAVREWKGPKRPFPPNYPYARTHDDLKRMVKEAVDSLDRGEGIPAEEVYAEVRAHIKAVAIKTGRA